MKQSCIHEQLTWKGTCGSSLWALLGDGVKLISEWSQLRIMKLDCLPSSPNSNGLKPALKSIKSLALLACPHMQAERNPLDGKSQVFAVACY